MEALRKNETRVGIADAAIISAPGTVVTIGLGSCVGILLYDSINKRAALIHVMLPDSTAFKNVSNAYKFADTAIPLVVKQMIGKGSSTRHLTAKIAGGASMFKFSENTINSDIGNRNIMAVKESLKEHGIKIIAEDVGGSKGRSMFVDADTGKVTIRVVGQGTSEL